jgi:CRP-like cAMP-binding protein/membrane protein YdbS with pleckstrin-like domain
VVDDISPERLTQIPLIHRLTPEQVDALLPLVEEVSLPRGAVLFRQGNPASEFYFVERGKILEVGRDPQGRETVRRHAGPGEYLGRYALVTGQPLRVTATAEEDSILLGIPLRDLQPLLFQHPDWRAWFFRIDIASRLRAVPLFKAFDDWDIYYLADQVEVEDYGAGETIFRAGDTADGFYIIDQGQVVETPAPSMQPAPDWPRIFAAGNYFGRYSLMHGTRRRATAIARTPTRLFRISAQTLQELLDSRPSDLPTGLRRVDVVERLAGVSLFEYLSYHQLRLLTGYVSLVLYRTGDLVARQGEPATRLMILDDGEAVVRRQVGQERPRPVTYLKASPSRKKSVYFGDHALLADEMRGATVEVTQPSTWIVLQREDFRRFLADAGLTLENLGPAGQPDAQATRTPPPSHEDRLILPHETRRHWIVPVRRLLPLVVLMGFVLGLMIADITWPDTFAGFQRPALVLGIILLFGLAVWSVWRYVDWLYDTYRVTDQAVVHVERVPLIREDRYEAPLEQIQNVNIMVGVLGRLLGYGDLSIDTAAVEGQVQFTEIPDPAYVQDLIQRAADLARGGRRMLFREGIRQQLEDQLYPERLHPSVPVSVLPPPEAPPPPPETRWRNPLRWLAHLFPQFEIREGNQITWRKHWFNLVNRVGAPFLSLLLTIYLLVVHFQAYAVQQSPRLGWKPLPPLSWLGGFQGWSFLLTLVLGLATGVWFLYHYVDWRNDVYIVNDNEVIDVERRPVMFPLWFFYAEDRKQASLDKVQNVNLRIPNILAILFNFGDVIVQTAGAEGSLDFVFVSNPRRVQAEVVRRLAAYRERQRQREFEERGREIAEWFETYHRLAPRSGPDSGAATGG